MLLLRVGWVVGHREHLVGLPRVPFDVVNFRLLRADLTPALRAARIPGPAIPSRRIHVMN